MSLRPAGDPPLGRHLALAASAACTAPNLPPRPTSRSYWTAQGTKRDTPFKHYGTRSKKMNSHQFQRKKNAKRSAPAPSLA
jgi:hypothetical protein